MSIIHRKAAWKGQQNENSAAINKMTRMAVLNIVKKYMNMARRISPELIPDDIGCHSFRHSKAMHMLEADINLVYIRDFLGHASTTTTEIYARASEKMKKKALSKLNPGIVQEGRFASPLSQRTDGSADAPTGTMRTSR